MVSSLGRCLLLGLLLHAGTLAQTVTVAPCSVSKVTMAGAPSAEYFEDIDHVLGTTRSPNLNAWLPYGVALTNRASQNIVAVAVRWLVTNGKGQNTGVHSRADYVRSAQAAQVAPGKSVIAVPVALLGASPLPKQFQLPPPPGTVASPGHLADFQNAQKVQVDLDESGVRIRPVRRAE